MNLSSIGNLRYAAAEHVAYISYLRGPVALSDLDLLVMMEMI
jgi:hypothetical protein